jgi:hypothetical protein
LFKREVLRVVIDIHRLNITVVFTIRPGSETLSRLPPTHTISNLLDFFNAG